MSNYYFWGIYDEESEQAEYLLKGGRKFVPITSKGVAKKISDEVLVLEGLTDAVTDLNAAWDKAIADAESDLAGCTVGDKEFTFHGDSSSLRDRESEVRIIVEYKDGESIPYFYLFDRYILKKIAARFPSRFEVDQMEILEGYKSGGTLKAVKRIIKMGGRVTDAWLGDGTKCIGQR